jgi:toxoflavin biosynthesis protein ToxC
VKHQGPLAGIAAHGPYVATAGYDNQLILWRAEDKRALARAQHDHLVNACAFSSDGAMLVSASSDYSARIYDVPSLRLKAALVGHKDDVDMAVFSPDDRRVATCALDRTIRIFDLTGRCLKVLRGHTGNILTVAWTRDGGRLVSSSVDGTVREWDAGSGEEIGCTNMAVRTDTLAIDRDGRILAGDDDGRIAVIAGGEARFFPAHAAGVKKLAFDEDAGLAITLSYDRTLAVWSLGPDGAPGEVARAELPATVWARAAAIVGPRRVAVGTFGSTYAVFDWGLGRWEMDGVEAGAALNAVAVVDGARYAIGDAGVLLHDGRPAMQLGSLCNFLVAAGGRLLSGGQLGRLFDARSGETLYEHHSPLNCGTAFVRHGVPHLAVGAYTGEALIFALDAGGARPRLVETLQVCASAIKSLTAAQGRLFCVCASTDLAWYDLETLALVRRAKRAHERIANAGCVALGGRFASVGRDRKLRIWSDDGEEVHPTPHPNSVKCVCANDDGSILMTGAYTGTVAAFDVAARRWISFERPTAWGISALAWDGARRRFLASSYDGQVYALD